MATGGYLERRLEQEAVLQHRLDQDHLLDFLRRDDGNELPEVGMQAAATRLSQVLLQKLATAADPEAHIDNYTKLIDLLCRLNREIAVTQKNRNDARRSLGPEYDPERAKEIDQTTAIEMEREYSELDDPAAPKPLLPLIPTATNMARDAAIFKAQEAKAHAKLFKDIVAAHFPKATPAAPTPEPAKS